MGSVDKGRTIRVSAVVLRDSRGAVLTVRKRNTDRFMFPGGKPEVGENAEAAAIREVAEELAVELDPARLKLLGIFAAEAANEPGCRVEATVYEHPPVPICGTASEIDELRWQIPGEHPYPHDLAPLLADHVFPALWGHNRY